MAKGEDAAERIRSVAPSAALSVAELDLADLASVHAFVKRWTADYPEGLHLLINNSGGMAIPRRETADGFEMQLGTNHLGQFALTGLLRVRAAGRGGGAARRAPLDPIGRSPGSGRLVAGQPRPKFVSSLKPFSDLRAEQGLQTLRLELRTTSRRECARNAKARFVAPGRRLLRAVGVDGAFVIGEATNLPTFKSGVGATWRPRGRSAGRRRRSTA